jgi:hypothetical protein
MTQAEFVAYAQLNPTQVNIWYTQTAPYTILGVTVPTIDFTGQNIVALLDQIQQIIVPVETGGNVLDITLNVITPQLYTTGGGNFYFFTVVPYEIGNITSTEFITPNADITFTPAIDVNEFYDSPYNVLQGSVDEARKSLYIMLSDRYKVGTVGLPGYTGPTNINQLLSGSATKADVQDSLYSDTGWTNARYEGTEQTYTGNNVPPAATGKTFLAVEYPISASISQINYQVSSSLAIYTDYFYTGIGDVPGFTAQQLNILVSGSIYTSNTPYIDVKQIYSPVEDPFIYLPAIGSTIAFTGTANTTLGSTFEIAYVTGISLLTTTPQISYRVNLIRRYNGTPQAALDTPINVSNDDTIFTINSTQIYQLQKNKLLGLNKALLLVQETGKILTLNDYGYVIGST